MHNSVQTLSNLVSRKIAIERILVLLLNLDGNNPSPDIRDMLINYMLLGDNNIREELFQILKSNLLDELDKVPFPSKVHNSMFDVLEEMLAS
ncbi:MAG: hypothetical protein PG981_000367 [Wolbachia endosymbiont of Ctenocephalides orientis wCori]|nr:MAG: hypothetical protein PG981_000367 [Wolbachia endosymbiont of Ctenocephalides orientis wCori]